jgi:hypothetical protein
LLEYKELPQAFFVNLLFCVLLAEIEIYHITEIGLHKMTA